MNRGGDFWSRRREAVAAETQAETLAREQEELAVEQAQLEERSDEEILAELDLPLPEEMETTDQVQALLKSTVPQRLRTRALRRLWRLNPVLANVDGLVDYGEDYTDAALVVENMQTLYKVGKGMFDKVEEAKAEAKAKLAKAAAAEAEAEAEEAAKAADAANATPDTDPDAGQAVSADDAAFLPETPAQAIPPEPAADHPEMQAAPVATRRMRFRFESTT